MRLAASRSRRLSPPSTPPSPSPRRGSSFTYTGKDARYETSERSRYGYRVSRALEDMTRSSRPRFRDGRRSRSSCNYSPYQKQVTSIPRKPVRGGEGVERTSSSRPFHPLFLNATRCREYPPNSSSEPRPLRRTRAGVVYASSSVAVVWLGLVLRSVPVPREAKYSAIARL